MKRFVAILIVIFVLLGVVTLSIVSFSTRVATTDTETETQTVADGESRTVPILMYHSLLVSKRGQYIVTPADFEKDILWILDHGYTPVFLNDLKAFTLGEYTMPSKPIVITFDDGHFNNLYYALPLLKKHKVKATISVIGAFTEYSTTSGDKDNPNYSHLTWDEVRELQNSGYCEIGNHTYNMHKFKPRYGIMKCSNETPIDYRNNLVNDLNRMQDCLKDKSGIDTTIFAYPFGKFDSTAEQILHSLGFDILLTCNEGVNTIKRGDMNVLSKLKRYNRDGNYSTEQFFKKIKLS